MGKGSSFPKVKYRAKDFSENHHSAYSKEDLMKHFRLKGKAAEKMFAATTQIGTCCAKMPLARRYKAPMNLLSRLSGLTGKMVTPCGWML